MAAIAAAAKRSRCMCKGPLPPLRFPDRRPFFGGVWVLNAVGGAEVSGRACGRQKKEGPSEVVDDGPRGICVDVPLLARSRRGVAGLTREVEVCSSSWAQK